MAENVARRGGGPIAIARRPVYAMLLPVPVVCFIGLLLTDIAYARSGGNLMWLEFSTWLNAAGLLFGGIAAVFLLIDAVRDGRIAGWLPFGLFAAAWLVELFNAFVHTRDGWTAVVPTGLTMSAIGAILILVAGWMSHALRLDRGEVS